MICGISNSSSKNRRLQMIFGAAVAALSTGPVGSSMPEQATAIVTINPAASAPKYRKILLTVRWTQETGPVAK